MTELPPAPHPSEQTRLYYYNALGQMTGMKTYENALWMGGATWCHYDALGRRTYSCDNGGNQGVAVFDGDNVVRTTDWRYAQGPGIDDPIVALHWDGFAWEKYFYLSDGRGRLLAFTEPDGTNALDHVDYFQNGGNQAGAIDRSTTFANSRAEAPTAAGVSFYRNRYYDQNTGRWTQEDPIGLAAGTNLYNYVGNNPATLTDPFGLCPKDAGGDGQTEDYSDCPPGTSGYRAYLAAQGRGGLANDIVGAYNACGESSACKTTALVGAVVTGAIIVRAGMRMAVTRTPLVVTSGALSGMTAKIVEGLRNAGPSIEARAEAVFRLFPASSGKDVITRVSADYQLITGGMGGRYTEILLRSDGSSVVRVLDVTSNTLRIVAEIKP